VPDPPVRQKRPSLEASITSITAAAAGPESIFIPSSPSVGSSQHRNPSLLSVQASENEFPRASSEAIIKNSDATSQERWPRVLSSLSFRRKGGAEKPPMESAGTSSQQPKEDGKSPRKGGKSWFQDMVSESSTVAPASTVATQLL